MKVILILFACFISSASGQTGQTGWASRYWDCCKAHCSWEGNTFGATAPANVCSSSNSPFGAAEGALVQSACDSDANAAIAGHACFDNVPWAVSDTLAYGFAAVPGTGGGDICGKCYKLTFTGEGFFGQSPGSTALAGKTMIVQASNIGYDVAHFQFDLQIPGGGVGTFDACSAQWGVDSSELGAQYGGFLSACQQDGLGHDASLDEYKQCVSSKCDRIFGDGKFPQLHAGCRFFVDWFEAADNPVHMFEEVECPEELTTISGMQRDFDPDATPPPTTTGVDDDGGAGGDDGTDSDSPVAPVDAIYGVGCDYSAKYEITDAWVGGYNVEVTIGGGSSGLRRWQAMFALGGNDRVSNSWNGIFDVRDSVAITVSGHAAWNTNIAPGGSVVVGFTVEGNAGVLPNEMAIANQVCGRTDGDGSRDDESSPAPSPTPSPAPTVVEPSNGGNDDSNSECSGARAVVIIDDAWSTGYVLKLRIDGGASGLTSWAVSFAFPQGHSIGSSWNTHFASVGGSVVASGDAAWNRDVRAGEQVEVGFVVNGSPAAAPTTAVVTEGCAAVRRSLSSKYVNTSPRAKLRGNR